MVPRVFPDLNAVKGAHQRTGDKPPPLQRPQAPKVAPPQPLVAVDRSVVLSSAKGENVSPPPVRCLIGYLGLDQARAEDEQEKGPGQMTGPLLEGMNLS